MQRVFKYVCFVLLPFIINAQSTQITDETKIICLKDTNYTKVIKEKFENYLIYTDGLTFIDDIDPDSIFDSYSEFQRKVNLKKELKAYFSFHDTLTLPYLDSLIRYPSISGVVYKLFTQNLARGEAIVFNLTAMRCEQFVLQEISHTINTKRYQHKEGLFKEKKSRSFYKLFSPDRKCIFTIYEVDSYNINTSEK